MSSFLVCQLACFDMGCCCWFHIKKLFTDFISLFSKPVLDRVTCGCFVCNSMAQAQIDMKLAEEKLIADAMACDHDKFKDKTVKRKSLGRRSRRRTTTLYKNVLQNQSSESSCTESVSRRLDLNEKNV